MKVNNSEPAANPTPAPQEAPVAEIPDSSPPAVEIQQESPAPVEQPEAKESNVSVEVFMKAPVQPVVEPKPGVSFRKKVENRQNMKA